MTGIEFFKKLDSIAAAPGRYKKTSARPSATWFAMGSVFLSYAVSATLSVLPEKIGVCG